MKTSPTLGTSNESARSFAKIRLSSLITGVDVIKSEPVVDTLRKTARKRKTDELAPTFERKPGNV